jgi:hypothetical protein
MKYIKIFCSIYKIHEEEELCYKVSILKVDEKLTLDYNKMKDTFNLTFDIFDYKHFIDTYDIKPFIFTLKKQYLNSLDKNYQLINSIDDIYLMNNEIKTNYEESNFYNDKSILIQQYYLYSRITMLLNTNFKKLNKTSWNASAFEFLFVYVFNKPIDYSYDDLLDELYNKLLLDNDIINIMNQIELLELQNKLNNNDIDIVINPMVSVM